MEKSTMRSGAEGQKKQKGKKSASDLASKFVAGLKPYKAATYEDWLLSDGVLKVDQNEPTIPPSPHVLSEVLTFLKNSKNLQWYPTQTTELLAALSKYTGYSVENILVFNGSDSALDCILKAFVDPGDEVIISAPTYDYFRLCAECRGATLKKIAYSDPFRIEVEKILEAKSEKTKIVYLVSPNNPTGVTYSEEDILKISAHFGNSIIIVDEAYYEFYGKSAAPLIGRCQNIIVTRSFSKAFCLAGFRCGYLVTDKANIEELGKIRNPREVNIFALVAAVAALEDTEYMRKYADDVREAKAYLQKELSALKIIAHFGEGNFFLVYSKNPAQLHKLLSEEKILVRNQNHIPQLEGFVRITVGDMDSAKKILEGIKNIKEDIF